MQHHSSGLERGGRVDKRREPRILRITRSRWSIRYQADQCEFSLSRIAVVQHRFHRHRGGGALLHAHVVAIGDGRAVGRLRFQHPNAHDTGGTRAQAIAHCVVEAQLAARYPITGRRISDCRTVGRDRDGSLACFRLADADQYDRVAIRIHSVAVHGNRDRLAAENPRREHAGLWRSVHAVGQHRHRDCGGVEPSRLILEVVGVVQRVHAWLRWGKVAHVVAIDESELALRPRALHIG